MKHELLAKKIVDALAASPRNKIELRNEVVGLDLSYQAFYKALKELRDREIVTVHKDSASLSIVWIRNEMKRLEQLAAAYQLPAYRQSFGNLNEGQRHRFTFKSLRDLDIFWTHAALVAAASSRSDLAILSLIPHDWFSVLRPESNRAWYLLMGGGRPQCNVFTHALAHERSLSNHPSNIAVENMFGENPLHQRESVYMNIIDDLIFTATLDDRSVHDIRAVMTGGRLALALAEKRGRYALTIEMNRSRASAIRKKAQKYFSLRLVPLHS